MTSLRRIFKDYDQSGALHALVSIQSAVGEGLFLTKGGDLVTWLGLRGQDAECLDPGQLDHAARRFESVLRIFDERFRLYQYIFKRQDPPLPASHHANSVLEDAVANRMSYLKAKAQSLYSLESYFAVVYEGWGMRQGGGWALPFAHLKRMLSTGKTLPHLERQLKIALDLLAHKAASFAIQVRDFMELEVLDNGRAFQVLRRLLNYAPFKADGVRLSYPSFVDFQACDSTLECHRDSLRLDDYYAQVLTLKDPPARTFAHALRGLLEIPANYVIATEWKRESALAVRRLIQSKRRHFHNSKASLMNYLNSSQQTGPRDLLIDDGAVAVVNSLGACLEEIEVHGRYFGQFSLTLVIYDKDPDALRRAAAQCFKVMSMQDAQLTEERANRLNAWLAVLPGNTAYNLRRIWLLNTNYADLALLHTVSAGSPRNGHLGTEYLAILEGASGVPYFFNLHHQDVAHALVLGATGSGKSFLLNFLVTHLQKYEPITYIFDLGGSYKNLTRVFGGSCLAIGSHERSFTINPFCLAPTQENLLFLFAFVRVLVESGGYRLSSEEERDLYEQIGNLYSVAPDQRRLFTLSNIVHRNLRGPLQKWVQGGLYAGLFDNAQDNLTLNRFQTFDFEGMDKAADQLEPLLFYILHRANSSIYEPQQATVFKAFILDEAWRFFRHPVIKAYIVEALKTWRKKNAAMILATQSSEDLLASEMLATVVESCPTKLFLANPGMDRSAYQSAFHLNSAETELIARLIPKQQILLKQPGASKLLTLQVDPQGYALYSNHAPSEPRPREQKERPAEDLLVS